MYACDSKQVRNFGLQVLNLTTVGNRWTFVGDMSFNSLDTTLDGDSFVGDITTVGEEIVLVLNFLGGRRGGAGVWGAGSCTGWPLWSIAVTGTLHTGHLFLPHAPNHSSEQFRQNWQKPGQLVITIWSIAISVKQIGHSYRHSRGAGLWSALASALDRSALCAPVCTFFLCSAFSSSLARDARLITNKNIKEFI